MYIHLGNEISINDKDVIGVFDIENTSICQSTKNYLKKASEQNKVINVSFELPKSFIVCLDKKNEEVVYISQISVSTLRKRAQTLF
ncbi:MAG: DUF370 domain-containing protein [Crenarchaeota archaeon]|nr:DUF370 domain-containing protein [Thermoproteota archaeon]